MELNIEQNPVFQEYMDSPEFNAVLAVFKRQLGESERDLEKALTGRNRDDLRKIAHRLKGSLGSFGFEKHMGTAALLEESAESAISWEVVVEQTGSLCQEIREIAEYLENKI